MKVKCVAHLAYYMFAAVGVAAEVTVDATSLRLNALEETVSTLLGAVTKLSKDNDIKEGAISSLEGAITNIKEENNVMRNELISIRSRRTTSTTNLDECLKVKVVGTKKKLVIKCKTDFTKPALFKKPVKIANDVLVIKGNLMITNGGNSFDDLNGKGNLVIGAKEVTQAGAHNIVIGTSHTFSSYGGLVLGENNTISGPVSAVTGGWNNIASGDYSVVSGGSANKASGYYTSVSGGVGNIASGDYSSVSGGHINEASGRTSAVSGGYDNAASGISSAVSGGSLNEASGDGSSAVSGGYANTASGMSSIVIGGKDNKATEYYSVVGQNPTTVIDKCLEVQGEKLVIKCETEIKKPVKITDDVRIIKGNLMITNGANFFDDLNGKGNLVIGASEVTQAGAHNIVLGDYHTFSSYGGFVAGRVNTISGARSAVTGGYNNIASGPDSVVSNGYRNVASGQMSFVSGGVENEASGDDSLVSGGYGNIANGFLSVVIGGEYNEANGRYSTVIGGQNNTATYDYSVVVQNP